MKRRIVAIVLSMAMAITMLPATSLRAEQSVSTKAMERIVSPIDGQPKDNLGRSATATAGYTNTFGISPEKINDGTLATADSSTSWNSWGGGRESISNGRHAYLDRDSEPGLYARDVVG